MPKNKKPNRKIGAKKLPNVLQLMGPQEELRIQNPK